MHRWLIDRRWNAISKWFISNGQLSHDFIENFMSIQIKTTQSKIHTKFFLYYFCWIDTIRQNLMGIRSANSGIQWQFSSVDFSMRILFTLRTKLRKYDEKMRITNSSASAREIGRRRRFKYRIIHIWFTGDTSSELVQLINWAKCCNVSTVTFNVAFDSC